MSEKKKYTFRYQLTYDEAYNAFQSLALRWSKKAQYGVMGFVVLLTVAIMIMFMIHPDRFYYFVIIIFAVILTAYVFYSPILRARKGAKAVARTKGTYEVSLTTDGMVSLAGADPVSLKADKRSRALELSDSFAVRMDPVTILCLPKRIMNHSQQDAVRKILSEHVNFKVYE
ncbi:MAG: hypothetical protein IJV66_02710 [Firmicutes bacterium]|nr:hypothetical protein [Bacillota bacterium]